MGKAIIVRRAFNAYEVESKGQEGTPSQDILSKAKHTQLSADIAKIPLLIMSH